MKTRDWLCSWWPNLLFMLQKEKCICALRTSKYHICKRSCNWPPTKMSIRFNKCQKQGRFIKYILHNIKHFYILKYSSRRLLAYTNTLFKPHWQPCGLLPFISFLYNWNSHFRGVDSKHYPCTLDIRSHITQKKWRQHVSKTK